MVENLLKKNKRTCDYVYAGVKSKILKETFVIVADEEYGYFLPEPFNTEFVVNNLQLPTGIIQWCI